MGKEENTKRGIGRVRRDTGFYFSSCDQIDSTGQFAERANMSYDYSYSYYSDEEGPLGGGAGGGYPTGDASRSYVGIFFFFVFFFLAVSWVAV